MELSFRTIRLFHVEEGIEREKVGDEREGKRTGSPLSIQLHGDEDNEERYGVERCLEA